MVFNSDSETKAPTDKVGLNLRLEDGIVDKLQIHLRQQQEASQQPGKTGTIIVQIEMKLNRQIFYLIQLHCIYQKRILV